MIIESSNPAHSLADSPRFREAMEALEFSLVIDVADYRDRPPRPLRPPGRHAVREARGGVLQLRVPRQRSISASRSSIRRRGTLPEPEMHARLAEALGLCDEADLDPLRVAALESRSSFLEAFGELIARQPELSRVGADLYRTLGPTLPPGLAVPPLWYAAHVCAATYPDQITRAGIGSDGVSLGDALFDAVLESDDGVVFTRHLRRGVGSDPIRRPDAPTEHPPTGRQARRPRRRADDVHERRLPARARPANADRSARTPSSATNWPDRPARSPRNQSRRCRSHRSGRWRPCSPHHSHGFGGGEHRDRRLDAPRPHQHPQRNGPRLPRRDRHLPTCRRRRPTTSQPSTGKTTSLAPLDKHVPARLEQLSTPST